LLQVDNSKLLTHLVHYRLSVLQKKKTSHDIVQCMYESEGSLA